MIRRKAAVHRVKRTVGGISAMLLHGKNKYKVGLCRNDEERGSATKETQENIQFDNRGLKSTCDMMRFDKNDTYDIKLSCVCVCV